MSSYRGVEFYCDKDMSFNSSFGLISFAAASVAMVLVMHHRNSMQNHKGNSKDGEQKSVEVEFVPPLPQPVINLLRASKLCFLATQSDNEPHLSLMNFTYSQRPIECLVLCTRRDTKKFRQITQNNRVAVLIHDFPHLNVKNGRNNDDVHGRSWSITLNGTCHVCDENSKEEEMYRQQHLINNPDYSQFISGKNIAVIIVKIENVRMCDVHDRVSYWNKQQGFTTTDLC